MNLDKLIEKHDVYKYHYTGDHEKGWEAEKVMIKEAVCNALELACERAKATEKFNTDLNKWIVGVNKESIMSVMECYS